MPESILAPVRNVHLYLFWDMITLSGYSFAIEIACVLLLSYTLSLRAAFEPHPNTTDVTNTNLTTYKIQSILNSSDLYIRQATLLTTSFWTEPKQKQNK